MSSTSIAFVIGAAVAAAGCAADEATESGPPDGSALEVTVADDSAIVGSFVHGGSLIEFRSEAAGPSRATLHLDVNGAPIDVVLDLGAQTFSSDGYGHGMFEDDVAALAALRDAFADAYPELVLDTLHGKLLARHADWLAGAPEGLTLARLDVDMTAVAPKVAKADADGCGGDGATCFPGTNGWDYAVYDPGSDGTCQWTWENYGENAPNCQGRCGDGCNHWFDDDYTWDCLDHDICVKRYGGSELSGNSNCGDEFWDASDDYVLTYGAWC